MYIEDTIAAISTAPGEAGIGIIRVSGPDAESTGIRIFRGKGEGAFASHYIRYGVIKDTLSGEVIDEAMAVLMKAPNSYTREDVLELHCHGGTYTMRRVLETVLRCGVRLAEPGEFTRRAFLNGRIDLVQAESVMDIIAAKSESSLKFAQKQREGALSERMEEVKALLLRALAYVEAYIDFPDDDIGTVDLDGINGAVTQARNLLQDLLKSYEEGRIIREGIAVLIIGKPNVGKSSLLNALLNESRAIVTHVPGTTRDIIEETISIDGLAVRLLDTAGIRHTADIVEQEGISRALELIPLADIVLCVLDSSRPFDQMDERVLDSVEGKRCVLVMNKYDLPRKLALPEKYASCPTVELSAKTGSGTAALKNLIAATFLDDCTEDSREYVALSRARHRDALFLALERTDLFSQGLSENKELEILAIDLKDALNAVATVTGEVVTDDLLDQIFSSFCIGK